MDPRKSSLGCLPNLHMKTACVSIGIFAEDGQPLWFYYTWSIAISAFQLTCVFQKLNNAHHPMICYK